MYLKKKIQSWQIKLNLFFFANVNNPSKANNTMSFSEAFKSSVKSSPVAVIMPRNAGQTRIEKFNYVNKKLDLICVGKNQI